MTGREVVLCAAVRTAIGTFNGSLKTVSAAELGATLSELRLQGPSSSMQKSALS